MNPTTEPPQRQRLTIRAMGGILVPLVVLCGILWWTAHSAATSARRIESALANIPSIIVICDGHERPLYVSESITKATGWTPKEIEDFGLGVLIPPEVLAIHNRAYAARMSRGDGPDNVSSRLVEFLRKDGTRGRALARISVIEHSGRREAYAFILPLDAENYDLAVTFKESEP